MGPAVATAAAQLGGNLLGAGINYFTQNQLNKKEREWNEAMYARQRQDALTDFAAQNAYNSPAAQMQRLKEAGLNPNLVYGNGAQAQSQSPIRQSSPGNWSPKAAQIDTSTLGAAIGGFTDQAIKQQQLQNMKAEKVLTDQKALEANSNTLRNNASTPGLMADSKMKASMAVWADEIATASVNNLSAQHGKIEADTVFTMDQNRRAWETQEQSIAESKIRQQLMTAQKEETLSRVGLNETQIQNLQNQIKTGKIDQKLKLIDLQLKELGINPNDPTYMRVGIQMLRKMGVQF